MSFELKPDETGNLFPLAEEMPCGPRQTQLFFYALPSTLERAEREEAAARLIAFSRAFDGWVGVSWSRIIETCKADLEARMNAESIQEANRLEEERVRKFNQSRAWRSFFTFGWYGRRHPIEIPKVMNVPDVPFSGIYLFGPNHIIVGFRELEEQGMVRIEEIGEESVIFPTEKLVLRIMEVQHIAA